MKKLVLALALMCAISCGGIDASLIKTPTFVQQQLPIDCAIASLAMAAGTTYAHADGARAKLGIHLEDQGGTPVTDIVAIGAVIGIHLVPRDKVNFIVDDGIVVVRLVPNEDDVVNVHAFYLSRGLVYDPAESMPVPWVLKRNQWAQVIVFLQKR